MNNPNTPATVLRMGGKKPPPVRRKTIERIIKTIPPFLSFSRMTIHPNIITLTIIVTIPATKKLGIIVIAGKQLGSHSVPPTALMIKLAGATLPCSVSEYP